jgi:hypothetical protein
MELGLSEFVKLSPLQATLAVIFGRLRVPSRDEAPPEIADRIEPSILREPPAARSGAGAVRATHAVPGVRRESHAFADWPQPYIANEVGEAARANETTESIKSAVANESTSGLLSTPRARQPAVSVAPKKARIASA